MAGPDLRGQRGLYDQVAGATGQQGEKAAELTAAFDRGQCGDVALDQGCQVRVEERRSPSRGAADGLRIATAGDSFKVVASPERRRVRQSGPVPESRIDEAVRAAVNLALGEGPEFDRLHPSGQRVRQVTQREDAGGAGQEEPTRCRLCVDRDLDRPEQLGCELDLVDHEESVVLDELDGIILRGAESARLVQQSYQWVSCRGGDLPGQSALAHLAGTVDGDHPGVPEGLTHQRLRVAREQRPIIRHGSIMSTWTALRGQMAASL